MTLQCPKCSGRGVHPSKYQSRLERLLTYLFLHPFRCHHCNERFFELATRQERESMSHRHLIAKAEQAFAGLHSEF